MFIYKKGIIVSASLSIVSLFVAIILNYVVAEGFWCNVMLGVFGSSLLAMITSIIGYVYERRNTMELFYTETLKLVNIFNRYQTDLTLDQKIEFFLGLSDYDTSDLNLLIGKMDFFNNDNRDYIYKSIYNPLIIAYNKSISHSWHFRMHRNGTGVNEPEMKSFIEEIEPCFIEIKTYTHEYEKETFNSKTIKNKLVDEIIEQLNGKYYQIMYGNKKKKQNVEEKNNGEA